jgi:RNA polymerase subunit RPABC4/transcription elongation factor Spt4
MAKYCNNCKQNVKPKRKFGIGTALITVLTCGIYLFFYFTKPKRCPMCNDRNFSKEVLA